jgi:hypothetical protein
VAIEVSLSAVAGVGACGSPVKTGEARFALSAPSAATKAVVASWVVLVPGVAVGAVGVPVRAGEASGAFRMSTAVTKAVVAMSVVLSPGVAVGAVGVPVSAGDARGALRARSETRLMTSLSGWVCGVAGNVAGLPVMSTQATVRWAQVPL